MKKALACIMSPFVLVAMSAAAFANVTDTMGPAYLSYDTVVAAALDSNINADEHNATAMVAQQDIRNWHAIDTGDDTDWKITAMSNSAARSAVDQSVTQTDWKIAAINNGNTGADFAAMTWAAHVGKSVTQTDFKHGALLIVKTSATLDVKHDAAGLDGNDFKNNEANLDATGAALATA